MPAAVYTRARRWAGAARRAIRSRIPFAPRRPRPHRVRFGSLRRAEPISRSFGLDRGLPIDRYYIEGFLAQHAADIRGRVLEAGDARYTRKFGRERVTQSDVIDLQADNPKATIVADLAAAPEIADETFDCVVLTQVLPFIPRLDAAMHELHRILKPNGVLLVAVPGICQISRYDAERWGDYWRFTSQGVERLCDGIFPEAQVDAWGNVLAAIAFLHGLSVQELRQEELDARDPDYQVVITLRATRT